MENSATRMYSTCSWLFRELRLLLALARSVRTVLTLPEGLRPDTPLLMLELMTGDEIRARNDIYLGRVAERMDCEKNRWTERS